MKALVLCVAILAGLPTGRLLVNPSDMATMDNVLFVDSRSKDLFVKGHIKGATCLDAMTLTNGQGADNGVAKPLDALRAAVAAAGIDPAKQIVVYGSAAEPQNVRTSTRVFWTLEYLGYQQVSILDGGYDNWVLGNGEVETGESTVKAIAIPELSVRGERLATMKDVYERTSDAIGCPVDFRANELYAGTANDPWSQRLGHIPRAKSVPAQDVFLSGPLANFKPLYQLQNLLVERGVDTNTPTIAYSSSGADATVGYFMLRMTGREQVSLYDGSIAEWGNNGQVTMELSTAPSGTTGPQ